MELDKRIIEGKRPLTCFEANQAKFFVGEKCYLTNDLSIFANLDQFIEKEGCSNVTYAGVIDTLTNIGTEVSMIFETTYLRWKFCIPCEWVKEEEPKTKYRPFSLEEFLKIFDIGDQIEFRCKDNGEVKHTMFIGYADDDVMIGIYRYSLSYLFENYELQYLDHWQPFGILEEE